MNLAITADFIKTGVMGVITIVLCVGRFRGIRNYTYDIYMQVFVPQVLYSATISVGTIIVLILFYQTQVCGTAFKISFFVGAQSESVPLGIVDCHGLHFQMRMWAGIDTLQLMPRLQP